MAEKKTSEKPETKTKSKEEEMYEIRLPKLQNSKEDKIVSINNRYWTIKRGVKVAVPRKVYKLLKHEEEIHDSLLDYIDDHNK